MFNRVAHALGLDEFDKRHKVAFVLLAVALLAVGVLWVFQLQGNIRGPLYANLNQPAQPLASQATNQETELRAKDTDGDGLNDWDELNLYKTSPYLADSDSDGFDDKEEIETGNDPNCPRGQVCTATTEDSSALPTDFNNPALSDLLDRGTAPAVTGTAQSTPTTSTLTAEEKEALREAFGDTVDPTTLRQLLLQSGMEASTLSTLSDEEIVATFNRMIQ